MSKMSLFLRPLGDEVASIYGTYFTQRQISSVQVGDRLDVLCTDGLNYIVVVKEYDKDADYGVLHFDKWSSKWDYRGQFLNLYMAKKGRYTEEISSRNNYTHLTLVNTEIEREKGRDKDKDKDKDKSGHQHQHQHQHQFQSGTKYPDDYFEKPRLDSSSRRRRIIDDNDLDPADNTDNASPGGAGNGGAKKTAHPSLTLKLKSSKNKGGGSGSSSSSLTDRDRDKDIDRIGGGSGDLSSGAEDIANSSEDDNNETELKMVGEKRRKLSRVQSKSNINGDAFESSNNKRRNNQSRKVSSPVMSMSSSEYIASLSKLSNASLSKMGITDISELSESNISSAMILYLNHCQQFEVLRGNLDIDESLKGVNRSLKILKSVIKSSSLKGAEAGDGLDLGDNNFDDPEEAEGSRTNQESGQVVPPYLVLKYCQLRELLEAKKCIELMISDIIK